MFVGAVSADVAGGEQPAADNAPGQARRLLADLRRA